MRTSTFLALALALSAAGMGADDRKNPANESREDVVIAGIRQFHERVRSPDGKVRRRAFDEVMPDQKLIETLFGEDAKVVWPRYEQGLKAMRASLDKAKAEFDRQGEVKSIELIDVRKQDVSGRYRRVLQLIPKDIPVYRAVVRYENGSGGSSSYLVIEGKMRFVRGLEGLAELIDQQKASAK